MSYGPNTDEEILKQFTDSCTQVAGIQGRVAYLLMSMHAINPILSSFVPYFEPTRILYANMLYGIGVMIYSRPNMERIGTFNRLAFSILGSLMFNYSSYHFFLYIKESLPNRSGLATFLGFFAGRCFMLHLLAFLYHVDARANDRSIPRNPAFESMYYNN